MAVPESKLTGKQQAAIVALLNEPTVPKAALAAKVGERTIYTWLKDPDFQAALRIARREAFSQAIAMCQRYTPLAVNTLAKVMADVNTQPSSKVAACSAMLKFGREALELDDLAVRLEALEQAAKDTGNGSHRPRSSARAA